MQGIKLLEILMELSRLDKTLVVEAAHDELFFVFSEDIDMHESSLRLLEDKYNLRVDSKDLDTGYVQSLSLFI